MAHPSALLLVSLLSVAWLAPAQASTVRVSAGWDDLQTMLSHGDYRARVKIMLKSSKQTSGILTGSTSAGLRLARNGREVVLDRDAIHAVRLVPRKARRSRGRNLAVIAAGPAGFGAGIGAVALCCRGVFDESRVTVLHWAVFLGAAAAVAHQLYRLGARSDRGSVLVVLTESADESPPDQSN